MLHDDRHPHMSMHHLVKAAGAFHMRPCKSLDAATSSTTLLFSSSQCKQQVGNCSSLFIIPYCRWNSSGNISIANNNRIYRKRKIKSINPNKNDDKKKSLITTKETIRRSIEQNIRLSNPSYRSHNNDINFFIDRAYGRIEFLRTKVFQFWNPDYVRVDHSTTGSQQQQQSAIKAIMKNRPIKQGLVMDQRWWMWNTILALSPAFLIAVFCEFIGKPKMIAFHKGQDRNQMLEVMGPEFVQRYEQLQQQQQEEQSKFGYTLEYVYEQSKQLLIHFFNDVCNFLHTYQFIKDEPRGAEPIQTTETIEKAIVSKESILDNKEGRTIAYSGETVDRIGPVIQATITDNSEFKNDLAGKDLSSVLNEINTRIQNLESIVLSQKDEHHHSILEDENFFLFQRDEWLKQKHRQSKGGIQNRYESGIAEKYGSQLDALRDSREIVISELSNKSTKKEAKETPTEPKTISGSFMTWMLSMQPSFPRMIRSYWESNEVQEYHASGNCNPTDGSRNKSSSAITQNADSRHSISTTPYITGERTSHSSDVDCNGKRTSEEETANSSEMVNASIPSYRRSS